MMFLVLILMKIIANIDKKGVKYSIYFEYLVIFAMNMLNENRVYMKVKFLFVAVALATLMTSCCGCDEKKVLFNGEDLTGWVGFVNPESGVPAEQVYGVKDGNIYVAGNPFGYLRTAEKYGDYKMHIEWRWIGEGTNSGIFHRVQDGDKIWPSAIECQLRSGKAGDYVMLGGSKISEVECVGEFPVKVRQGDYEKPVGEWNEAEIICEGKKITVYINGQLQNECTTTTEEGYIALQSEGGPLEFRNIYITCIE